MGVPKVSLQELAQHPVQWSRKGKFVGEREAGDAPAKTGLNRLDPGTDMEELDG